MDTTEFKRRFLPCHKRFYHTAFRLTGNTQDAEDLVQEAYAKLWNRRNELEGVENAEAYGVMLVKNLCFDWMRRNIHDTDTCALEEVTLATDDSPGHTTELHDEAEHAKSLINQLPNKQRRVMWLRDVNDCSFEEIEQATGLNATNIRVLLSRARKKIREQFKRMDHDATQ